jgi:15-cis-phytoene synthase
VSAVEDIAIAFAPVGSRAALSALLDYDRTLGRVVATTTEPLIGQMRLTWWYERMVALDAGEIPAEPVIRALDPVVRGHDVTGQMLARLVEGWEVLLEPLPLGDEVLRSYAEKRGDGLFALAARIIGAPVVTGPGAGWALIDFAAHCSDADTATRAWTIARSVLATAPIRGPRTLRILAHVAKSKARAPVAKINEPAGRWTMVRAVLP